MSRGSDTTWFFGDDAFRETTQCLTSPDDFWSRNRQIDIVVALDELAAWCEDRRDYDDRMHTRGWASAAKDFTIAYEALGPKVKFVIATTAQPVLELCEGDLGADADEIQALAESLVKLRAALATPGALAAAWQDLQSTCAKPASPINSLDCRRDTFWATARAGDRNVKELADRLRGVLGGDPFGFYRAERHLGEVSVEPETFEEIRQRPVADLPARLALAGRLLEFEPPARRHVVWVGFREASLHPRMAIEGEISLYDGAYFHALVTAPPEASDRLPEELRNLDRHVISDDEQDFVIARVDLGVGRFPDAIGLARSHAAALVAIAAVRGGGKPWKPMSGYLHAEDGRITALRSLIRDEFKTPYSSEQDGTALRIGEVAKDLSGKLTLARTELKEIVDALQWWQASTGDGDAKSILLNVRLIELVAARAGERTWTTFLEKFLKNRWIQHMMRQTLLETFNAALYTPQINDGSEADQKRIQDDVVRDGRDGYVNFDVGKALHAIESMEAFLRPNTTTARAVRTIRRRVSGPRTIMLWARSLEADWSAAVRRLERLRNSIMHGGPFTDPAITRVHGFSHQLSAWAVVESMDAVLERVTVRDRHVATAERMTAWRRGLAGPNPYRAIFATS